MPSSSGPRSSQAVPIHRCDKVHSGYHDDMPVVSIFFLLVVLLDDLLHPTPLVPLPHPRQLQAKTYDHV